MPNKTRIRSDDWVPHLKGVRRVHVARVPLPFGKLQATPGNGHMQRIYLHSVIEGPPKELQF